MRIVGMILPPEEPAYICPHCGKNYKSEALLRSTFRTNTLKLNSLKPSSPRLLTQKRKEERRYGRL